MIVAKLFIPSLTVSFNKNIQLAARQVHDGRGERRQRQYVLSSIQEQGKRQWAQTDTEKNTLKYKTPSYCSTRVVEHWNRLPKETVESPSMEVIPPAQYTQQPALVTPVLIKSAG